LRSERKPDTIRQVTKRVRKWGERRLDSLLGHCLLRAVVVDLGGWDKAQAQFDAGELNITSWAGVKAMPRASRVAGFIVLWASAMRIEDLDAFSITEYQRYWHESERQAYRLQKEFRELWPEYETPNELARQLVQQMDKKATKKNVLSLPMTLQVTA
jgi:hypothetical protein